MNCSKAVQCDILTTDTNSSLIECASLEVNRDVKSRLASRQQQLQSLENQKRLEDVVIKQVSIEPALFLEVI
jgi:hypothetical protein